MSSTDDFDSGIPEEADAGGGGGGYEPDSGTGAVYRSLSFQPMRDAGDEMFEEGEPSFNFVVQAGQGGGAFDLEEPPMYRSLAVSSMAQPQIFDAVMAQPSYGKPSLAKPSLGRPSLGGPGPAAEAGVSAPSTDYSGVTPKPVPELFPLEQTHFFVRGSPDAIAKTVSDELGNAGANFVFKLEKCKWKGTLHDNGGRMVDFRIKLFETDAPNVFLLESQRRSGSGHHLLLKMHTHLHNKFGSDRLLSDKSGSVIDRVLPAVRDVYQVLRMREIPAGMVTRVPTPVC